MKKYVGVSSILHLITQITNSLANKIANNGKIIEAYCVITKYLRRSSGNQYRSEKAKGVHLVVTKTQLTA